MKRTALISAAAIAAGLAAAPAHAQTNYAGQWACQISHQQNNSQGGYYSGWHRNLVINVSPNGQYEAQGTETGMSGTQRFQSQGSWNTDSGLFSAQGPEQKENPVVGGLDMGWFMLLAKMDPGNRTMALSNPVTSPQTGEVSRNNTMCERRG